MLTGVGRGAERGQGTPEFGNLTFSYYAGAAVGQQKSGAYGRAGGADKELKTLEAYKKQKYHYQCAYFCSATMLTS